MRLSPSLHRTLPTLEVCLATYQKLFARYGFGILACFACVCVCVCVCACLQLCTKIGLSFVNTKQLNLAVCHHSHPNDHLCPNVGLRAEVSRPLQIAHIIVPRNVCKRACNALKDKVTAENICDLNLVLRC